MVQVASAQQQKAAAVAAGQHAVQLRRSSHKTYFKRQLLARKAEWWQCMMLAWHLQAGRQVGMHCLGCRKTGVIMGLECNSCSPTGGRCNLISSTEGDCT
jgi:hypothetical protein